MKKILALMVVFILGITTLMGCSGGYTRDTSSGSIVEERLDTIIEMAENKEDFVVIFTQITCKDCIIAESIMTPYLENHSVEIKDVVLDHEGTTDEEIQANRKKINSVFPNFNATPSMYYVKDGKVVDEIIEFSEEAELEEWVVKNQLDKK
ncbi:MAG: thioredoxin family protein [Clostridium sp.]